MGPCVLSQGMREWGPCEEESSQAFWRQGPGGEATSVPGALPATRPCGIGCHERGKHISHALSVRRRAIHTAFGVTGPQGVFNDCYTHNWSLCVGY